MSIAPTVKKVIKKAAKPFTCTDALEHLLKTLREGELNAYETAATLIEPSNVWCQENEIMHCLSAARFTLEIIRRNAADDFAALVEFMGRMQHESEHAARALVVALTPLDMNGTMDYGKLWKAIGANCAFADTYRLAFLSYNLTTQR